VFPSKTPVGQIAHLFSETYLSTRQAALHGYLASLFHFQEVVRSTQLLHFLDVDLHQDGWSGEEEIIRLLSLELPVERCSDQGGRGLARAYQLADVAVEEVADEAVMVQLDDAVSNRETDQEIDWEIDQAIEGQTEQPLERTHQPPESFNTEIRQEMKAVPARARGVLPLAGPHAAASAGSQADI
jgi:hypothetical protein